MFTLGTDWWEIIIRSVAVYAAVLLALRVFGRRSLGQRNAVDLVLILIVANAVQNAMIGPDTSLIGGLIAATTLFGGDWLIGRFTGSHEGTRRMLEGDPAVLINHGQVLEAALRSAGVTHNELAAALREHAIESVHDVKSCILEVDGSFSIIPATAQAYHSSSRRHTRRTTGSTARRDGS